MPEDKKTGNAIRRSRPFLARLLCLLLALLFYAGGLAGQRRLSACQDTATLLLEGSSLTAGQAASMLETERAQEQPVDFALWAQQNEVTVKNEELQRQCTVSAVVIYGRSDLVMPGSARLEAGDTNGCLLGAQAARQLFGNTDVTGLSLKIGDRERTVRGILYDAGNTVLYGLDSRDGEKLTRLALPVAGITNPETLRQEFLVRHGLSGELVRTDYLTSLAQLASLLTPFLLGCRLLGAGLRSIAGAKGSGQAILERGALFSCAAVFFCFLAQRIQIPSDMIPTRWSDFGFWREWLEGLRRSLLLLLLMEKTGLMGFWMATFGKAMAEFLLGALLLWNVRVTGSASYRINRRKT